MFHIQLFQKKTKLVSVSRRVGLNIALRKGTFLIGGGGGGGGGGRRLGLHMGGPSKKNGAVGFSVSLSL